MAQAEITKSSPSPGPPSSEKLNEGKLWVLSYRGGRNPMPMFKHFYMKGTLEQVVARCKEHCMVMGNRFVRVDAFLSDLRADEQDHAGSDYVDELLG